MLSQRGSVTGRRSLVQKQQLFVYLRWCVHTIFDPLLHFIHCSNSKHLNATGVGVMLGDTGQYETACSSAQQRWYVAM